ICFLHEDAGDRVIDEDEPLIQGPLAEPTFAGERMVQEITAAGGRGVVLRFGLFYGPNARMVDEWLSLARFGMTTLMGAPDAYQPSIHLDDAASAVVAALAAPPGIYNVADEPLTKGEFLAAFAAAFGLRRAPRPMPAWLVSLV